MQNYQTPDEQDSIEEMIEDAVEGAVHEEIKEMEENSSSFIKKAQTFVMMTAAVMISAGQWNDTVEVFSNAYQATMANFTHQLEYELIDKIHVGNSLNYVMGLLGEPFVVKNSSINSELTFLYYSLKKFDICLISHGTRVVGYTVFTKVDDFTPNVPFSQTLGKTTLQQQNELAQEYYYDAANLVYFLERQELNKSQMFLNLIQGYVEYAAVNPQIELVKDYHLTLSKEIEELVQKETFSAPEEQIAQAIINIRKSIYPNFYSIAEISADIIAESLLSRYEYKMYTKS